MPEAPAANTLPDMATREEESELIHEVADAVGALMEFWGFKRVMGRLWTVLYLTGEPLGAAELCERLAISSGAASMTLADPRALGRGEAIAQGGRPPRVLRGGDGHLEDGLAGVARARAVADRPRGGGVRPRPRTPHARGASRRAGAHLAYGGPHRTAGRPGAVGRGLLTAMVQQHKVDLAPLVRFATGRRR